MFELLFILFVIWIAFLAISEYMKKTRIERQKQRFEQVKASIRNQGIANRDSLVRQSQQADLEELASIVKERLNAFKPDIPPRLFQNAEESINNSVKNMEFDRLYALYKILVGTRKNLVFQELNRFFNWGYMQ